MKQQITLDITLITLIMNQLTFLQEEAIKVRHTVFNVFYKKLFLIYFCVF